MPQQAWSDKDERQYRKIRQSGRRRGRSEERAKEIAARTVNKQRRREGRTSNRTTQGTGNPNAGLEERSKAELYNKAKDMDIKGRSSMSKRQLVNAIRRKNG